MTSSVAYDFNVASSAFDRAQEGACYLITYYPPTGLFADQSAAYQRIDNVVWIESLDPSSCG